MDKIFFISGFPRTGSNLLSSILNQNSDIHSEGNSALCRILWDINCIFNDMFIQEDLVAVGRKSEELKSEVISRTISCYYEKNDKRYVFDKNISWTTDANIDLIKKYIDQNPKIIVMTRDVIDVVKSYMNVLLKNGWDSEKAEDYLLCFDRIGTNPILRPAAGIVWSKLNNSGEFIFVDYDSLINNPRQTVEEIYSFCNIPHYNHQFENIDFLYPEVGVLDGLMEVRPTLQKRNLDVQLSEQALEKIEFIQQMLLLAEKQEKMEKDIETLMSFYYNNLG